MPEEAPMYVEAHPKRAPRTVHKSLMHRHAQ
jgi:hypothetical protein